MCWEYGFAIDCWAICCTLTLVLIAGGNQCDASLAYVWEFIKKKQKKQMSVYEEEGGIALITWLLEETFFFAF